MDQIDSLNLTYDYLDECEEYTDSLEATIASLSDISDSSKVAEDLLKVALSTSESINNINDLIIKEHKKDNKRLKRQLIFYKFVAGITSVAALVFGVIVLVPGV